MRCVKRRLAIGGGILTRVRRAVSRESTDTVAAESETEAAEERGGSESDDRRSMVDFVLETGLTPEEYVVKLLDERGGSMRQQEIIAETKWSRSAVSRLLCSMERDERIVRVRFGSEKEVYLPDAVPDLVGPFEPATTAEA